MNKGGPIAGGARAWIDAGRSSKDAEGKSASGVRVSPMLAGGTGQLVSEVEATTALPLAMIF